jgi:hypothetical protein
MGTPTWAIPVGVLGGLIVIGLIWLIWAFPKAWQRGVNADNAEVDARAGPGPEAREAQRLRNRATIERYSRARARERGEVVPDDDDLEMALGGYKDGGGLVSMQPLQPAYSKQPTMATGQVYVSN